MNSKKFLIISGTIFLIVGTAHFLRVLNGWPVSIGGLAIPMWLSWIVFILTGYLAYYGLKKR